MADLSARRELNRNAGDALSTAFELALTPALLAVIGWRLDAWLGTSPLLLLVLFLFTVGYEAWKHFARYDARMREHEAQLPGRANPTNPTNPGRAEPGEPAR